MSAVRIGLLALSCCLAGPVLAQDREDPCERYTSGTVTGWQLARGTDAKAKGEAATFSHLKDDAKGQSKTFQAALIMRPWVLFGECTSGPQAVGRTYELDVAVAANRDTTTGSEADHTSVAAGLKGVHALGADTGNSFHHALSAEYKHKRITDGSDRSLSWLGQFNLRRLTWRNEAEPGDTAMRLAVVPLIGLYSTHTTGNTGKEARNGRYAGPVFGLSLQFDAASIGVRDDRPLVSVSASVRRQPESRASGDFKRADYDLGEVTVALPLQLGSDPQLKPRLALSHAAGTDRMGGKAWKRQTRLEFTASYGL